MNPRVYYLMTVHDYYFMNHHVYNLMTYYLSNPHVFVQDCWSHVNVKKAVLPKLFLLLREGGRGCASRTFTSLLPFLNHLPVEFYNIYWQQFYDSLILGLV